jgi:hypothetical protein
LAVAAHDRKTQRVDPPAGDLAVGAVSPARLSLTPRRWQWRAVDQHGIVLDILVQSRRDQHAAERFLRQVVDGVGYDRASSSPISWPAIAS